MSSPVQNPEQGERSRVLTSASLHRPSAHTGRADEACPAQDPSPQTGEAFRGTRILNTNGVPFCHAAVGSRPYYSPEYSPDFHKFSSTLHHITSGTMSHIRADTSSPIQQTKTRVPYAEKKRLMDKLEEVQEVKQLDEWKPAADVFTSVLKGLDDKASK